MAKWPVFVTFGTLYLWTHYPSILMKILCQPGLNKLHGL